MTESAGLRPARVIALVAGPALGAAALLLPGLGLSARVVAGLAGWMAIWWVTEALPLAATALLPIVVLPLAGVQSVRTVAPRYAHPMIFLFLGGFVLALAVERSGAHRRIALRIVGAVGRSPRRLVWAFLLSTALLSMWLSNTATTLMMLPIAGGVAGGFADERASVRLLLAVAFGASIGGMGTLVGTPPNLVLAGMAPRLVPGLPPITFGRWMLLGVPLVLCLLPLAGLLLARGLVAKGHEAQGVGARVPSEARGPSGGLLDAETEALGPMSPAEVRALGLLGVTALLWIFRADMHLGALVVPGWSRLLPDPKHVTDAVPAVAGTIAAVLIPDGSGSGRPLCTWDEIRRGVPWGILLLFGGGFALAGGVHVSRLDVALAHPLHGLAHLPLIVVLLVVVAVTAFVTNLTSNTATATLLLPVMATLALALGEPPYLLMAAAAVAASCAFVLPVATPPNAIVMGSGRVSARDLFREGLLLNLLAVPLVTGLLLLLGPRVL